MVRAAAEKEVAVPVPCVHESCASDAILSQRLPTGWANLCRHHYEFHHQRQADAFCAERGLVTVEQKQAWIKEKLGDIAKRITGPGRNPGEDDE